MALKFRLEPETNTVTWDYSEARAGLTEQEAMVISVTRMAQALENIAIALGDMAGARD